MFDISVIEVDQEKINQIKYYIDNDFLIKTDSSTFVNIHQNDYFINRVIRQNTLKIQFEQTNLVYQSCKNINGTSSPDMSHIKNIQRGILFEEIAIKHFEKISSGKISQSLMLFL